MRAAAFALVCGFAALAAAQPAIPFDPTAPGNEPGGPEPWVWNISSYGPNPPFAEQGNNPAFPLPVEIPQGHVIDTVYLYSHNSSGTPVDPINALWIVDYDPATYKITDYSVATPKPTPELGNGESNWTSYAFLAKQLAGDRDRAVLFGDGTFMALAAHADGGDLLQVPQTNDGGSQFSGGLQFSDPSINPIGLSLEGQGGAAFPGPYWDPNGVGSSYFTFPDLAMPLMRFSFDTPFAAPELTGRLSMTADNQIHAAAYSVVDPRVEAAASDIDWDLRRVFTREVDGKTVEYELRLGSEGIDPPFGAAGNTAIGDAQSSPAIDAFVAPGQVGTYRLYVTDSTLGLSTVIEQTFTGNPLGPTGIAGDVNGDNKVDLTDFGILKENFGNTAPAAVPEPSAWLLAAIAAASLPWIRRRAARRAASD